MSSNAYNTGTLTLAAAGSAGDTGKLIINGEFMRVLNASYGSISDLKIGINNAPLGAAFVGFSLNMNNVLNRKPIYDYQQFTPQPDEYYAVYVQNLNAAQNVVTIGYGSANIGDDRVNISGSITTLSNIANNIDAKADETVNATVAKQIKGALSDRVYIDIWNDAALGTSPVRYGDSNTAATYGAKLPPQQSVRIYTTDAVYVYNPNAAAITICYNEYRKT